MSAPAPEAIHGAGDDVPGMPGSFAFGVASNGFAAVAVLSMLATIIMESSHWFPVVIWDLPGLYWLAVLASLITGATALKRKPWRGMRSAAGILIWLFVLTPFFPAGAVLLWLTLRQ